MTISKIKNQLKKFSKDFDLNYDSKWFSYMWISHRLHILIEYIGYCPDPVYMKYGNTPEKRIENISKFIASKDFLACLKRYGGQVASKEGLAQEIFWINKIKDNKLKSELLAFYKRLKKKLNRTPFIALMTTPRNKKEEAWLLKYCLRHEWIHILLQKDKIYFQKIKGEYGPYDEGIDEYMGAYLDKSLDNLERFRDEETYSLEKKGWVYAIKFRELLKNSKTPKEKKVILLKLLKSLSKKEHEKR